MNGIETTTQENVSYTAVILNGTFFTLSSDYLTVTVYENTTSMSRSGSVEYRQTGGKTALLSISQDSKATIKATFTMTGRPYQEYAVFSSGSQPANSNDVFVFLTGADGKAEFWYDLESGFTVNDPLTRDTVQRFSGDTVYWRMFIGTNNWTHYTTTVLPNDGQLPVD